MVDAKTKTVLSSARKIKRDIFRTRSNFEAAMVGASKMERIVLKQSIAMLDALNVELDKSAGNLRKLAHSKPRKRVRRSARVGR